MSYYSLSDSGIDPYFYGDVESSYKLSEGRYLKGNDFCTVPCPRTPNHGPTWDFPKNLRFRLTKKNVGDFIWMTNEFVVPNRVLQVLIDHEISGFEAREANCEGRFCLESGLAPFWQIYVTKRVHANLVASGMRVTYRCDICGAVRYSQWSKRKRLHLMSDIVSSTDFARIDEAWGFILISEKLKDLIISESWKPCFIRRLEDISPL